MLGNAEWIPLRGLPVTLPSRTASDPLRESEDSEAAAQIMVLDGPANIRAVESESAF